MLALIKLRKYDEYTFTHSLNVASLAISFGRHVGLPRKELKRLGLGAIFHDLGKIHIPEKILCKAGKLDDQEFSVIKMHPDIGCSILAEQYPDLPSDVVLIVRHHHERQDGSGYPTAMSGSQIPPFITISGMCDVYDALSSDRVYHKGMLPHEALKVVFSLRVNHFPPEWVEKFVQCLGIYPIGTTVRLNSGEVAVVMTINTSNLLQPVLRLILDADGRFLSMIRDLDLSEPRYKHKKIHSVLDPTKYGIDPAGCFLN
ncbi:MAG: HD-GYP domain-containing protein [Deltaproteobacteria bacterium]|nr:HD-GYP domain-containing protein [Deltaproteobacteria bacterium]